MKLNYDVGRVSMNTTSCVLHNKMNRIIGGFKATTQKKIQLRVETPMSFE